MTLVKANVSPYTEAACTLQGIADHFCLGVDQKMLIIPSILYSPPLLQWPIPNSPKPADLDNVRNRHKEK